MEETMPDVNVDVTTEESSTQEDTVEATEVETTEESEEVEPVSEDVENPEATADGNFVPRTRLNEQKAKYEAEIAELRSQIEAPVQETPYTPEPQPAEYPDWVFNEAGEILPDKFIAYTQQKATEAARAEMNRAKTEETIWAETYKEYPQLQEDTELKKIVENGAYAEFVRTGKAVHPKEYAKKLFDRFAEKKQEGARIAQENKKVVDTAYLESNSPASNRERTLTNADLAKATPEQIQKWEESGALDTALRAGTLKGTPLS